MTRLTDDDLDGALRLEPEALKRLFRDMMLPPDPYLHPFPILPGGGLNSVKGPIPETEHDDH